MKILIVNSHLETGGIRQSLLNLIENINDLGFEIDLQLLKYDQKLIDKYEQLNNIRVCKPIKALDINKKSFAEQKNIIDKTIKILFWIISKIFGKKKTMNFIMFFVPYSSSYDIAISFSNDIWTSHVGGFIGGCNDYVIKKVNARKKIAWVHNDSHRLGFSKKILLKTYKEIDTIVNVSFSCKKMFDKIVPEYKYKSKVVYNMFDIHRIIEKSKVKKLFNDNEFHIVTVARLDNQQKRIDRVISCCENLINKNIKNFKWHIIGDGPDKEYLVNLSKEKKVDDYIVFEGRKENPYTYMKCADVFVLTTDYEAYGMVVTEALITGTPVISTKYPAAKEIIDDQKNGIITDFSDEAIFNAVYKVISEPEILKNMKRYIEKNEVNNDISLEQFKEVVDI